ncbi:5-hydroxytryptamine receptor-like [Penaeus chinensis]|uniref:5-hydroxytryptamine receptor-like n=1 Tax=Penaeus chinensis TaxID=139456 RepID=UPI001FB6106B|nr:5-hydroxytryptamine receptor-like [Penaeus chinensis]
MGRENTTSDDWNYTLPNLLEYLDGLLEGGGQPHSNPILPNPNKDAEAPATTLWGALTSSSTPPTTTTTTPAPINKPMFVMNFTLRTTVDTLLQTRVNLSKALDPLTSPSGAGGSVLGLDVDPSDVGLGLGMGVATLSSASSTSSASSSSSPSSSSSASTPDLLLAGNESLVTLDDSFWLAGGNDSANQSHFFGNETSDGLLVDTVGMVITSVILGIMILTTVIGNVFVIAAILLERNLQQVANFLIVSLAVADLMVACLVMPLGAVYAISKDWILGPELCDMWTSSDVLCCTASILHLVAIALDRYWAVTQVDYIHSRNGTRIGTMILMVWLTAVVVSIAPLFGWKDPDFLVRVNQHKKCLVSQDVGYQIFATMATFYVPLTAILILYWKIFQAARKRIHKNRPGEKKEAKKKGNNNRTNRAKANRGGGSSGGEPKPNGVTEHQTTAFTTVNSGSPDKISNNGAVSVSSHVSEVSRLEMLPKEAPKKTKKETLEAKREKKAAKTLAIITGAFVVCWLPFFVTALLMSICPGCYFSDLMFSIFLWLGYFNSTLNPIIYTIFSPEFREAFKRILFGRKAQRYRPGKVR